MKKTIMIISVLAAAFTAWIVIFPDKNPLKKLLKKPGDTPAQNPASQPINTGANNPGSFMPPAPDTKDLAGFPLSQGSRGAYVSAMQAALNNRFGSALVVDGIFGPKTYKAISANGFNADSVTYKTYLEILG